MTRRGSRRGRPSCAARSAAAAATPRRLARSLGGEPEDDRRDIVAALEQAGDIERLLDSLDDNDGRGTTIIEPCTTAILGVRTVAANLATVSDRLGGGIFGWNWTEDIAITDGDTLVAFHVLSVLPLDVRERLFRSDRAELLDKLERNLPEWFVEGPGYRSLAVERDAEGRLLESDRGGRLQAAWERQGTAAWLIEVRRLIRDGKLKEAFHALDDGVVEPESHQAQAPGAPSTATRRLTIAADVRAAIVDRLDALGVMDAFLEELPYDIRQGRDYRLGLLRICTARSIPNLLRHIDSLLRLGLFDWAVRSWEADLAYVMFRALPPHEQRRFGRLGEITSELSADARTWSGTNLLDAPTSETRVADVSKQLADETLWRASRKGQLPRPGRARLRPRYRGDGVHLLEALPRVRRRQPAGAGGALLAVRPEGACDATNRASWRTSGSARRGPLPVGKLIFGLIWIALRDTFAGDAALRLDGTIEHGDFDLNELGDLLGNQIGGARFAERRGDVSERANLAGLKLDRRKDTLHLEIPELAIDGLGILRQTWAANIGRIRVAGLVVDATFETNNLRHPRRVNVKMDRAGLDDILYTTPTKAHGAAGLDL